MNLLFSCDVDLKGSTARINTLLVKGQYDFTMFISKNVVKRSYVYITLIIHSMVTFCHFNPISEKNKITYDDSKCGFDDVSFCSKNNNSTDNHNGE